MRSNQMSAEAACHKVAVMDQHGYFASTKHACTRCRIFDALAVAMD